MLRFAGIQLKPGADKLKNLTQASELALKAVANGANLISFPECFNSPYGNQFFAEYAEPIPDGQTSKHLSQLAKEQNVHIIGGSIPEKDGSKLFNTSLVFNPAGEIIAKHRKIHLFDIDIPGKIRFQESETLSPGNSVTTFDCNGFTVGVAICYDIRFPELAQLMRLKGADFLVYPGAFNMTTGPVYFELLTRARAVDNQVYCASIAPATDREAGYVSWGHSVVVAPTGQVVDSAGHEEKTIYCDVRREDIQAVREGIPTWKQKRDDVYKLSEA